MMARRSGSKVVLAVGTMVAILFGIGTMLSVTSKKGTAALDDANERANAFNRVPTVTPIQAQEFAEWIVTMNELHPAALTYDSGSAALLVPMKASLFERVTQPGSKTYRAINILDQDGTFGKRWKASLESTFGKRNTPKFGLVRISTRKPTMPSSSNPLDYLDFKFRK